MRPAGGSQHLGSPDNWEHGGPTAAPWRAEWPGCMPWRWQRRTGRCAPWHPRSAAPRSQCAAMEGLLQHHSATIRPLLRQHGCLARPKSSSRPLCMHKDAVPPSTHDQQHHDRNVRPWRGLLQHQKVLNMSCSCSLQHIGSIKGLISHILDGSTHREAYSTVKTHSREGHTCKILNCHATAIALAGCRCQCSGRITLART